MATANNSAVITFIVCRMLHAPHIDFSRSDRRHYSAAQAKKSPPCGGPFRQLRSGSGQFLGS
jgi:hypothetical protein